MALVITSKFFGQGKGIAQYSMATGDYDAKVAPMKVGCLYFAEINEVFNLVVVFQESPSSPVDLNMADVVLFLVSLPLDMSSCQRILHHSFLIEQTKCVERMPQSCTLRSRTRARQNKVHYKIGALLHFVVVIPGCCLYDAIAHTYLLLYSSGGGRSMFSI